MKLLSSFPKDEQAKKKDSIKANEDSKVLPNLRKKANTEWTNSLQRPPRHPSAKTGPPKQILPIDHERQKAKLNNLM